MSYRTAVTEIMNDALTELNEHFMEHWGQSLVNVLRALHMVYYGAENLDEDEVDDNDRKPDYDDRNTDNWLLSRRQRDFREGTF